jgi:putative PIN family toxin of toxin-antitoxin system
MKRPRVVLDTNVVISAAIKPGGLEARIVELVAARRITLCLSAAVISEYEVVFARPKFARIDPTRIIRLLQLLKSEAITVMPQKSVTASKDESDNRFLECAEAADAQYLITGNNKHFPKSLKSTLVINAREFLGLDR